MPIKFKFTNNRQFSSSAITKFKTENLNPFYISGFTDGEGCFSFSITKNQNQKIGWAVRLTFNLIGTNNPSNKKQFNLHELAVLTNSKLIGNPAHLINLILLDRNRVGAGQARSFEKVGKRISDW